MDRRGKIALRERQRQRQRQRQRETETETSREPERDREIVRSQEHGIAFVTNLAHLSLFLFSPGGIAVHQLNFTAIASSLPHSRSVVESCVHELLSVRDVIQDINDRFFRFFFFILVAFCLYLEFPSIQCLNTDIPAYIPTEVRLRINTHHMHHNPLCFFRRWSTVWETTVESHLNSLA